MLQNQAYLTQALGKPGCISRQDPVPQSLPAFAEGNNVVAGKFTFPGTNQNQVVGTAGASTVPTGICIFERLQLNLSGLNSLTVNDGEVIRNLLKGCAYIVNDGGSAEYNDHVLVDPLTGTINTSSSTSQSATSGTLTFAFANETYTDYNTVTNGTLTLIVDGTEKVLSTLNFGSADSMTAVAQVITTALSSSATCTYNSGSGLTITSATTGATSNVEFVSASADLEPLLGSGTSVNGTNAMIDTGWTVLNGNVANQTIEVTKI